MFKPERIVEHVNVEYDRITDDEISGEAGVLLDWVRGLVEKHGDDTHIGIDWFGYDGDFELRGFRRVVEPDDEYDKRVAERIVREAQYRVDLTEANKKYNEKIARAVAANGGGLTSL